MLMVAFWGWAGRLLSTLGRGCLEEYEEQVCAAGAPIAPSGGVTGGASDRKDMGSCPCRKAVPVRVPG